MLNSLARTATTISSLADYRVIARDAFFPVDFRTKGPCSGEILCRLESRPFGLFEVTSTYLDALPTRHRSRDLIDSTVPDFFILNIVRRGAMRQKQFGRSIELSAGHMALFSSRFPMESEQLSTTSAINLKIPGAPLRSALGTPEDICAVPVSVRRGLGAVFYGCLMRALRESDRIDEDQLTTLSHQVIDLFALVGAEPIARRAPAATSSDVLLDRAERYIAANIGDPQLNATSVAKALRISAGHLHAIAQKRGPTIGRIILRKRLERCADMLRDNRMSGRTILDIAMHCGFNNASHFCRVFKAHFGQSPRAYRRAA